jgi:acid phosphatase (class A)
MGNCTGFPDTRFKRGDSMKNDSFRFVGCVVTGMAVALLAGCQSTPPLPSTSPEAVGEFRAGSGYLRGYLNPKALPNSLALLPKPPAEGSAEQSVDLAVYTSTRALRGKPRWDLATRDANLKFPKAASVYACTMDVPISQEQTPHLNMLLRRTLLDAGLSTYAAKDSYNRKRPFLVQGDATCTPAEEANLMKDGSYPSGHSALGWAWALVLSEVAPERADALLARGFAFGQSRVICGVHWQSDVNAGRVMGSAAVAVLHTDPTFTAQLAAAKAEVADARSKNLHATGDCKAEAAALAP